MRRSASSALGVFWISETLAEQAPEVQTDASIGCLGAGWLLD